MFIAAIGITASLAGCSVPEPGTGDQTGIQKMERDIRRDMQKQLREDDPQARVTRVSCVDESDTAARCFANVRSAGTSERVGIDVTYDRGGEEYIWEVTR